MDDNNLIGKCGFYCGSCPTYIKGECDGCRKSHNIGDCFTFDCVDKKEIEYCGQCEQFPCDEILFREKATVLDKRWLLWKRSQQSK